MAIIIGLGNPGEKFKNTRHNAGFIVLDKFAENNNFPDFKLNKKYNAEISEGNFGEQEVMLAKPQTFMNESGRAVQKITKPYTLDPKPLIVVVHDDIDLPLGKIKIVKDRGSAGHKGVESIVKCLGTEDFIRIRIGICPEKKPANAAKFVLKKFTKEEIEIIKKSADALLDLIKSGLQSAMNKYN